MESDSSQIKDQLLEAAISIVNMSQVSSASKALPTHKLKAKLYIPRWSALEFLKIPPQAAMLGTPMDAPSVLHLIQQRAGGAKEILWHKEPLEGEFWCWKSWE
jgi:hypothetical protein